MVPFERALVSSYKPSIHIISVSATVCLKLWIVVLGGGCEPPILGEGEAVGSQGWYRSKERWSVSIGRP